MSAIVIGIRPVAVVLSDLRCAREPRLVFGHGYRQRRLRFAVALVICAMALLLCVGPTAASATAATGLPAIVTEVGPPAPSYFEVKAPMITYTGDGSGFLAGSGRSVRHPGALRWTRYAGSSATATGSDWRDNCMPDCASGPFTPFPVRLHAYRPARVDGHLVFTRIAVTYTRATPPASQYIVLHTMRLTYAHDLIGWRF